jgi:hypothetical protein
VKINDESIRNTVAAPRVYTVLSPIKDSSKFYSTICTGFLPTRICSKIKMVEIKKLNCHRGNSTVGLGNKLELIFLLPELEVIS